MKKLLIIALLAVSIAAYAKTFTFRVVGNSFNIESVTRAFVAQKRTEGYRLISVAYAIDRNYAVAKIVMSK